MLVMPLTSDPNEQGWFECHELPWSDVIATQLLDVGIERVEEMKFLPNETFLALFFCPEVYCEAEGKASVQRACYQEV